MLTRLELDGFKTFQDFKLELAPFQVIVGLNGVGKSNLFDALRLLARLADDDLRSAFQALRGEAGELFTTLPGGQTTQCMRLAAEMLVERQITDSWGAHADLKHTRLRYELEIVRRSDDAGLERLYVTREALTPIRRSDDSWFGRYIGSQERMACPAQDGTGNSLYLDSIRGGNGNDISASRWARRSQSERGRENRTHGLEWSDQYRVPSRFCCT